MLKWNSVMSEISIWNAFPICLGLNEIRHCGLVKLVNIGSGNDLLPDGTKPLPELTLTYH